MNPSRPDIASTKAIHNMLKHGIGMRLITDENLPEVWARIYIVQNSLGTNGNILLEYSEVRRCVGFSVAHGETFGSAELMKRIGNRLRERADAARGK